MANYYGTTVSEGGTLKPESIEAVREIVGTWHQVGSRGEISVEIDAGVLIVWGYDDFVLYDEDGEGITEEELKKLVPHLTEPLIIKSVGNETCRYVGADAYIVSPHGVAFASLDDAIHEVLSGVSS